MKKFALIALTTALGACSVDPETSDAAQRQTKATKVSLDAADREIGMPRISNFAQRKLLKNAYEDMDQTTLVYVYVQSLDGRFVCLGQAVGYGVSLGTQFTAPYYNTYPGISERGIAQEPQAEPNGLFMPESGAATIVNLVDPGTGKARTALVEPNVVTSPNKLPASAVAIQCPGDVDPANVSDAKETSAVKQRD
jgi:hypothetical protein